MSEEQSSADRLRAALKAHTTYMVQSDFSRAGIRSGGQLPPEMDEKILPYWDEYGRYYDRLFRDAARDGYLASDVDLHALRLLVIGAGNWATHWFDPKGKISADDLGDVINRMVFSGCAGPAFTATKPSGAGGVSKSRRAVAAETPKRRKSAAS